MKKISKEELVDHFRILDKQAADIFNKVADDEYISPFKLNLYVKQLENITNEAEITLSTLNDKMNFETKLFSRYIIPGDIIFGILMIFSYTISYPVGVIANIVSMSINAILLKKLFTLKEVDKNIEEDLNDIIPKLSNTINNCNIFLSRHYDRQQSETKINNTQDNFVNYMIWQCLSGANLIELDDELRFKMIKYFQKELNAPEDDLNQLILRAIGIYNESPFMEETEEVLKLSRTKKDKKRRQ